MEAFDIVTRRQAKHHAVGVEHFLDTMGRDQERGRGKEHSDYSKKPPCLLTFNRPFQATVTYIQADTATVMYVDSYTHVCTRLHALFQKLPHEAAINGL